MPQQETAQVPGKNSIHAETKDRDASFIMTGHHCHGCNELYYVHSGACRFLIEDSFYDLTAGDMILIPPRVLHYTRYVFGACTRTVILFRREDVTEDLLHCTPQAERLLTETVLLRVPLDGTAQVNGWVRQLTAEDKNQDPFTAPLRRCCLQGLLLQCCRVCDPAPGTPGDIRTGDKQILKAARYISEHYMNPITTGDVARAVSFSPNYLSRRFRAAAGIGLHEYIVFVRLHHAAQELLSTTDSITAIALRCGFSDSNYFKDSFKKKYGVTPRSYRKISLSGNNI